MFDTIPEVGPVPSETESLLERAAAGDSAARQELLANYEGRLKRMIRVRMDARMGARLDPSDVLQDVFLEAWQNLSSYLEKRPVDFYPWLRSIAWERLVDLHRAHVVAQRRSVKRERRHAMGLSGESAATLVTKLAATGSTASVQLLRKEVKERLAKALEKLGPTDREVLILRYLEELSVREVAGVVGASESAVKVRCFRAVKRLHEVLESEGDMQTGELET